jgi:SP family sugar:H+ symporter-like MFS transporter
MSSSPGDKIGPVILLSVVAAIGGFLFGFDSGVINGTVDALKVAFQSQDVGTGFNVASILLGCAVGAFVAGSLADRFGRRPVLFVSSILFLISAWGSGIASGSTEFVIYRVIGGLAVGAASVICPAYISEIAPARYRGSLSSLQQMAIVLGLFAAFLSNYLIAAAAGGAGAKFWLGFEAWQWMFWVEIIPSLLFFLLLFTIPESPRYLVSAGRRDHARSVLTRLQHPDPDAKIKEISDTIAVDHQPSFSDIIDPVKKRVHPVVWVGIGLAILQQAVGINVIFYYSAVLWQAAGFSEQDALADNVITASVNVGATIIAIIFVDRLGRKPLLLWGSIGMSAFLALVAFAFSQGTLDAQGALQLPGNYGFIALLAANLYVFFFGISWGPVMWVMLGEMFPNRFRGTALALAGFAQWMANFAVTITFPIFLKHFGLAASYGLYGAFAILSIFFVIGFVKETKGLTLEEMES